MMKTIAAALTHVLLALALAHGSACAAPEVLASGSLDGRTAAGPSPVLSSDASG